MATYQGTPGDDLLQGTIADDLYLNLGAGVDNIKDPGGKNTIDISSASGGAVVDLSPGKTSTLSTGSFTLGSLVVGNNPDVIFVADISGSTFSRASGVAVGDLNKDGAADTILDGEIAGFIALNQSLIDRGLGDTARISLVAFDDTAQQIGATATPKTDANTNGVFDIVENLQTLQTAGGTNYQAGLIQSQTIFKNLNTPSGKGNLIFLSDGEPNGPDYKNEVTALKNSGYNLSAFGVGNSIPLAPLQVIDPNAKTFTTTTELVSVFSLQGGTGTSTETSIESFIGTKFDDKISGNILSNKIDTGAGDDVIAGVNLNSVNPGKGEIDTLTGGVGKDSFLVGDINKVYYDDGDVTTPGTSDYALITDFNSTEGDIIKLSGSISQYSLDNSPIAGIKGQALFLNKPNSEPRELIAIFQNSTGLTIDTILGSPKIQIAKGADAAEPSTNGNFVLTRTGDITNSLTVNLATATGSATSGVDYKSIAQTVTFLAGSNTAKVDVVTIDDPLVEPTETISIALATGSGYIGTNVTAEINLTDNDTPTNPTNPTNPTTPINSLIPLTGNILQVQCTGSTAVLKFTKTTHEAAGKGEVCAFVVDDAQGRIGNIAPGDPGYLAAALDRSQVIFSTLSDRSNDNNFDRDSQRNLQFNAGDRLEFCLIPDDTIDSVKANLAANKPTAKVLFSLAEANIDKSNQSKFTALANNGGYQIAWEDIPDNASSKSDKDFNDFVFKIENFDKGTLTAGSSLQSKSEGQVIDLRGLNQATVKVDTLTVSDAAYNNYIGFYAVEDAQGTLANGLKPTDLGYAEAAIKSVLLRSSKNETQSDLTVATGKILAPVVIANGTFDNFLTTNPTNQANSNIHAYFSYIGANTDKVDHFRLLGDNKFGVEDIFGGGDRDYNDIIFQMNVKG